MWVCLNSANIDDSDEVNEYIYTPNIIQFYLSSITAYSDINFVVSVLSCLFE